MTVATMRTNTANRIADALKARFSGRGGARAALRALGIDSGDLLGPAPPAGKSGDPARELRVKIEQLLPELHLEEDQLGPLMRILEEHCPLGNPSDDQEKVGEFLRGRGLGEPDVRAALDMVQRRRGMSRDAESERDRGQLSERDRQQIGARKADAIREREFPSGEATDTLPKNGLGGWPRSRQGLGLQDRRQFWPGTADQLDNFKKLLRERGKTDEEIAEIVAAGEGALTGSVTGDAAIDEIQSNMARIKVEPGYGSARRPAAPAQTARQRASFDSMFPDAGRIISHA